MGLAYIVAEFCTQSHLATEDFGNASEGIRFTRRFKKYTYWFRQLLGLCDNALLLIWKVVRFPWKRATGRQSTAFNKTLIWDWKEKPNSADGRRTQTVNDQARRRSSTQHLVEGLLDEGSSRGSRTPERSEDEGPENQTRDNEQHDPRDESPSRIRMTTLQLPTPMHTRYSYSQPPSPSSEASLSPGPSSHWGD